MDCDLKYVEVGGEKYPIPDIALGKVIPSSVELLIEKQEQLEMEKTQVEKRAIAAERKERLHFWVGILITIVCTLASYLLGKFC